MPVTVPLADLGVLGIHGPRGEVASLAKALLIQAVCLHSPEDLVVAAAASPEMDLVSWLRWVPHTHATGSPIGGPHLASDRRSADELLQAVLDVAEFREASTDHGVDRRWPWVLVVLDRLVEPDPHLVAQVLDRSPEVGISVLWLSDSADRVPPQCRVVAELADRTQVGAELLSRLWFTDPETPTEMFSADGVDRSLPDTVARSLAPLRDASSATSTSSIPRFVPLLAAHGIDEVTPTWIQQEWAVDRRGDGGYALETVVGTTADGPLTLDLVSDGPHGLIGGTSGAGKSELIQALVAGLVAYQSPRDLSLLFIDFKGGSASEVFKDLPHISGRVTDLDESLALRAQVSLAPSCGDGSACSASWPPRTWPTCDGSTPTRRRRRWSSSSTSSPRWSSSCPTSSPTSSTSRSGAAATACTSSSPPSGRRHRWTTTSSPTPTCASRCACSTGPSR